MFKTRKKNPIAEFSGIYEAKYGVDMDLSYTVLSKRDRILVCLIKGLLIFLCVFGSTGLFITSFELPHMMIILLLFIAVMSFFAAMFYYSRLVFNVGYIILFVIICLIAYFLHWYANSGINAILNIVLKVIDDKLNLNGVREYSEVIKNREVTITCCLILMSCLSICFYNSAISGRMSPFGVFLLAFPIVQICMYFDDDVNYFYLAMIAVGFLGVLILRRSGRFYMPYRGIAHDVRIKGEHVYHEAGRFTTSMKQMVVFAAVIIVSVGLLAGLLTTMSPRRFRSNFSSWKDGTDKMVKEFALNGLAGFFNQYAATGGLNEGQLGGIRQVVLSFEPHLDLKIVPDNPEGIYLRGFIGEVYGDNRWNHITRKNEILSSRRYNLRDQQALINLESDTIKQVYNSELEFADQLAKARVSITNIGARDSYLYTPYFTNIDFGSEAVQGTLKEYGDYALYDMRTRNKEMFYTYYPVYNVREALDYLEENPDLKNEYLSDNTNEMLYSRYVYANYLYIPDNIQSDVRKFCQENNIGGDDRRTVINRILNLFKDNYMYTLSPGITPSNKDFVTYFLNEQKCGYCAHFATAAAILLRANGIPARYVEGYFIQFSDALVTETIDDENVSEWYQGFNYTVEGDEEPSLISVQARAADAHAWVEVYYEGFGWVPVEFTVGAMAGESEEGGTFWDRFRGFFGEDSETQSPVDNVTDQLKAATPYMIVLVFGGLAVFLVILASRFFIRKYRLYHKADNMRLVYQYTTLSKLLRSMDIAPENNIYHKKMGEYLVSFLSMPDDEAKAYIELVEKASFGNEALSAEQLSKATDSFKFAMKQLRQKAKLFRRLYMRLSV